MTTAHATAETAAVRPIGDDSARVGWVDAAKGICIILVVMLHSTLGAEDLMGSKGWLGNVVTFAWPFRMPDFFLISGLFLARVIDRPWRRYLDRKVVHFVYFYVLWLTIQFAFKGPGMVAEQGAGATVGEYLLSFVQPYGTLWFIYMLPVFFVITRLLKGVPAWLVLAVAAVLEILPIATGSVIVDEFCSRFVYFYAGYALAGHVFDFADGVRARPMLAVLGLAIWAPINAWLAFSPAPAGMAGFWQMAPVGPAGMRTLAEMPVLSIALGIIGILAVITVAVLVAPLKPMRWLAWLGGHSIVVYLAFFLSMAVSRSIMIKSGLISDVGTVSALTTAAGVAGPVVLYFLVQWTGRGHFLFERPAWAHVDRPAPRTSLQPAE